MAEPKDLEVNIAVNFEIEEFEITVNGEPGVCWTCRQGHVDECMAIMLDGIHIVRCHCSCRPQCPNHPRIEG